MKENAENGVGALIILAVLTYAAYAVGFARGYTACGEVCVRHIEEIGEARIAP